MARIRTIKPEAHLDEELWDLEQETELPLFRAFTGLWCQADREGRFEWRPRKLQAAILPYWQGDFARVLDALVTGGFLVRYTVEDRDYGWLPTFTKHQFVNNKEPKSTLPAPPESVTNPEPSRVNIASPSRASREADAPIPTPSPSLPVPNPEGGAGGPTDEQTETVVPLDLADRADRAGIPEQFAKTYRVSTEAVRFHVRETAAYWSIGPGSGRRKRNWLQTVRARLHELGKAGRLGEVPRSGKAPPQPNTGGIDLKEYGA